KWNQQCAAGDTDPCGVQNGMFYKCDGTCDNFCGGGSVCTIDSADSTKMECCPPGDIYTGGKCCGPGQVVCNNSCYTQNPNGWVGCGIDNCYCTSGNCSFNLCCPSGEVNCAGVCQATCASPPPPLPPSPPPPPPGVTCGAGTWRDGTPLAAGSPVGFAGCGWDTGPP